MTTVSIRASLRWPIAAACGFLALAGAPAQAAVGDTPSLVSASAITAAGGAGTAGGGGQVGAPGSKADATATLEQCLTAATQSERSATFAGEMIAVTGTARMEISIGLLERVPDEEAVPPRQRSRPGLLAGLRAKRQNVHLHQAGDQPLRARVLPRLGALPLAERQGPCDQGSGTAHPALRTAGHSRHQRQRTAVQLHNALHDPHHNDCLRIVARGPLESFGDED